MYPEDDMQSTSEEFIVRGFSLPQGLSDQLNEEAKRQKRNASNMLQVILAEHFARLKAEPASAPTPTPGNDNGSAEPS
jgi:hypothetical protein